MSRSTLLLLAVLMVVPGWWAMRQATPPLFNRLSPTVTGVTFTNRIDETDSLHIFRYEYLYNGNGVGVGDFNNDGRPDLFFSGNTVPHKLYLNQTDSTGSRQTRSGATRSAPWRFSDITIAAGVAGNGTWGTGVSVVDINADGLLDVYVCHSGKFAPDKLVNELFVNQGVTDGVPRFREMARHYGLDLPGTQTTQAAFLDYDRDGDLDAFILNHSNHTFNPLLNTRRLRATPDMQFGNRLLRNDNGKFTDVTLAEGIVNNPINFGLGVGVADLNNDGWPDLYTTSDYTEQDCLYLNQHDATGHHTGFQETIRSSMGHTSKFSMGCDIADYNNDTLPDVVTLDMLPADNHRQKMLKGPDDYDAYKLLIDSGYVRQQMRNMLQLNQGVDQRGQLRFSELGQLAGVSATDWSWSALLADFDNDGWKDLFVSNGYLRDFTDLDFMKYTVADAKLAEAAKGNLNFQTLDLVHKMPSNRLKNYLFRNNHDLTFSNQSAMWGIDQPAVSGASAYADFDGDGDLDLVICHQNEPVSLYRNNAERQADAGHFARILLAGAGGNTQALGARVVLETTAGRQLQFVSPTRGYQASVETTQHFGLGDATIIKRLTVYWPDGRQTQQTNLPTDQTIRLRQTDASTAAAALAGPTPSLFRPLPMRSLLPYRHRENDFVDFKVEVLIPYQLSRLGPALAAGDVNGDGLDDVYLGGAVGQAGELWLQQADGRFTQTQQTLAERSSEDVNALFFDADRDGDLDLYVASGGNEYEAGAPDYQDRLYRNDGRGTFGAAELGALPAMRDSKLALAAADYDSDGDLDLFVGGRGKAGSFPAPSVSYLLRNDTPTNGPIRFTDVTDTVAPACRLAGMVQAAAWADLDGDKQPELVIAGDWMPVRVFKNRQGVLTEQTQSAGLSDYTGLWAALLLTDIDNDGDVDIVAGNAGLNNPFRASASEPMSVVAGDIDKDGVIDPIWTYYVQGKPYPAASRDELLDQVVPLRKRFTRYHQYADATVETLLNASARANATTVEVRELASGVFLNQGTGTFRFTRFPMAAQLSRASSLLTDDVDGDGKTDLLLAGNFYPYRVQHGPCDASFGAMLRNTGTGTFSPLSPRQSGFWAGGDVRTGVSVRTIGGRRRYIFAVNDASLIGFEQ